MIAETFVRALSSAGIKHVFISPGSRSTPLTLAFAKNSELFKISIVYDERSAAFQALGCAIATKSPTVLVCTSGSAVANYFPAVVEASQSEVPLVILTADRPFELQDSGSNQTMPQPGIFGKFVKKSLEMPVADSPKWITDKEFRDYTTIRANYSASIARQHPQGPVHINFPFRKPLEPKVEEQHASADLRTTEFQIGRLEPDENQVQIFEKLLSTSKRPLLILGPNAWKQVEISVVEQFAMEFGIPVLSDILSGMKVTPHEQFLQSEKVRKLVNPDLIIHMGKVPIGNALNKLIEESDAVKIQISDSLRLHDDLQKTNYFFNVNPTALLQKASQPTKINVDDKWPNLMENLTQHTLEQLDRYMAIPDFEGAIIGAILNQVDETTSVFLGNSLPVRHAMYYGVHCPARIYGNRGVSGIDGNISTALGLMKGLQKHVVAIVGDLTFIHDLNALTDSGRHQITVIIINNQGGGIFRRLPISNAKEFPRFFLTPHDLSFEKIAEFYGMKYRKFLSEVPSPDALKPGTIIEIATDSEKDLKRHREVLSAISRSLESSFI